MRLSLLCLLVTLTAAPAFAQSGTPTTGATATPPAAPAPTPTPGAPTATTPTSATKPHAARKTMQQRFEAANTTHDGKLTLAQAKEGKLTRVASNFDAIDSTKKGYVTMEDIRGYNRAQRAAKKPATH